MIKLTDLIKEDITIEDADRFVNYLRKRIDLDSILSDYAMKTSGNLPRSEEDYATDYYNVIDQIANQEIN